MLVFKYDFVQQAVHSIAHAVASDLLDVEDSLDRCVEVCVRDGDEIDDVVVNLVESGDDNVDRLAADDVLDVGVLRKTRAGGNWLTEGIFKVCVAKLKVN